MLERYVRGGRLVEIPARRSRRLVVLGRLALEFEVGRRYPEAEVNAVLRRFHDDHAALRRYLVDEGYLSRDHGEYWRTGGPVDVDAEDRDGPGRGDLGAPRTGAGPEPRDGDPPTPGR